MRTAAAQDAGDEAAARRLLEEGLRRCPGAARLHLSLGVLEDVAGRPAAARALLRRGLQLEPDNPHLHHALGLLEYKEAATAAAAGSATGTQGEPASSAAAAWKGGTEGGGGGGGGGGGAAAARERFRRAAAAAPGFAPGWLSWARLEEVEGRPAVAREVYRRGASAGAGSPQLYQAMPPPPPAARPPLALRPARFLFIYSSLLRDCGVACNGPAREAVTQGLGGVGCWLSVCWLSVGSCRMLGDLVCHLPDLV